MLYGRTDPLGDPDYREAREPDDHGGGELPSPRKWVSQDVSRKYMRDKAERAERVAERLRMLKEEGWDESKL